MANTLRDEIDIFFSTGKLNKACAKFIDLLDEKNYDLQSLASEAQVLTRQFFGNTIKLFTPLYISNYCENGCVYCAFCRDNKISRSQLSFEQIRQECEKIAETGLRQVIVLTGEAPTICDFEYIKNALKIISEYFSSINIEVYPMETEQYRILVDDFGVDAVTMYQETYDKILYDKYHLYGKKKDYSYRLNGLQRACEAGIRGVQLGALLGLAEPTRDLAALAIHTDYLQKKYPEVEVSVSFPRICPIEGGGLDFEMFDISDKFYARIIAAFRIAFPNVSITLSTRENEKMRNGLLNFGVTKISAGVSTSVGGGENSEQFEIADDRSVEEITNYLQKNGFQAVMHDWNFELTTYTK